MHTHAHTRVFQRGRCICTTLSRVALFCYTSGWIKGIGMGITIPLASVRVNIMHDSCGWGAEMISIVMSTRCVWCQVCRDSGLRSCTVMSTMYLRWQIFWRPVQIWNLWQGQLLKKHRVGSAGVLKMSVRLGSWFSVIRVVEFVVHFALQSIFRSMWKRVSPPAHFSAAI